MPECTCQQISEMLQSYLDVVMETIIEAIEIAHSEDGKSKPKKKPAKDRKDNPWNEFVKICKPQGKSFSECAVEYRAKKAAGEV